MSAHVDGDDVIISHECRGQMIELMRHAADAMQHDERRLVRGTPVQIVKTQAVHNDEPVGIAGSALRLDGHMGKRSADDAAGQQCPK